MGFIEFVIGAAIGAGSMVVKNKVIGSKSSDELARVKRENDSLSDEVEKLKQRQKEAENQIEDLMAENQRLIKKGKEKDESQYDIEDERDALKSKIKKLQVEKEELERKVQEYGNACKALENELNLSKNR